MSGRRPVIERSSRPLPQTESSFDNGATNGGAKPKLAAHAERSAAVSGKPAPEQR